MINRRDSIAEVPYRIGYSFRQAGVTPTIERTSKRPYFAVNWAESVDSKKKGLRGKGKMSRYPSVWRREAKRRTAQGLMKELPDFQELGEAPGPTDKPTTSSEVSRGMFGFLDNIIKTAGGLVSQHQQLQIVKAQAGKPVISQYAPSTNLPVMGSTGYGESGTSDIWKWGAIVGIVGIGAYFIVRR